VASNQEEPPITEDNQIRKLLEGDEEELKGLIPFLQDESIRLLKQFSEEVQSAWLTPEEIDRLAARPEQGSPLLIWGRPIIVLLLLLALINPGG
jgi:hypothetical protein